jgi:hypothetical protein
MPVAGRRELRRLPRIGNRDDPAIDKINTHRARTSRLFHRRQNAEHSFGLRPKTVAKLARHRNRNTAGCWRGIDQLGKLLRQSLRFAPQWKRHVLRPATAIRSFQIRSANV